jgi:peptide/nickel transport system ATP-binding protein
VSEPLLEVSGLTKHFPVTSGLFGRVVGQVRAVDDVSFAIAPGETLGLVGESGSGKTTIGRSVLRLIEPTAGRVRFDGIDVTNADASELRRLRRSMQIVFQDPYSSLNPRLRVRDLVGEALEVHGISQGAETERRVARLLAKVGLSPGAIHRYPHEFSGGQRQRIGVARAIALEPKLVVLDEPVSALDVSIQAQVVNLLLDLRREMGLAYLFIAHDLSVVRHLSHRIAVMYLGELVELASSERLFQAPSHPYTRALLSAIPVPDPKREKRRILLAGDIPSPLNPPSSCRFHTRCPAVMERCRSDPPELYLFESDHPVRCLHAEGLSGDGAFRELDRRIEAQIAKNIASAAAAPARPLSPSGRGGDRPDQSVEPKRPPPPALAWLAARPLHRRALVAVLLVLLVLGVGTVRSGIRKRAAARELDALVDEILARERVTQTLPASLDELGWRLPPIFGGTRAVDPWGRELVYRVLGTGRGTRPVRSQPRSKAARFELSSLGPDGVPSADDLVRGRE